MKINIKTVFFIIVILVLGAGFVQAKLETKSQEKQHEQQLKDLVSLYADTLLTVRTEYGDVTEKYLTSVQDLDGALNDNDRLRDRVKAAEKRLDVKVREVEELYLRIATLELEGEGEVTVDSTGGGFVEIVEDTAGVRIEGKVFWPSGMHKLTVTRDPINFIITLQATKTGALVKKSIEFPDQPWITVDSWEAVVLDPEADKKKNFFSKLIPNFKDMRFLVGVSAGSSTAGASAMLGGDLGISLSDTHLFINLSQQGSTIHLARSFALW
jgi:hypothetical protein